MFGRKKLSDSEIIRRVLSGQRELFGALVERHMPLVHALAYARTGRGADAEDVAQETFIRALQHLPELREPAKFAGWIAGIARNVASTATRSAVRRDQLHAGLDAPTVPDPHRHMERNEMHAMLRATVMALEEGPRETLLLHYFAGKPLREVADTLGISVEAAKKRLQRARELLSTRLTDELEDAFRTEQPSPVFVAKTIAALATVPLAWEAAAATATGSLAVGGAATLGGLLVMKKIAVVLALLVLAVGVAGWRLAGSSGDVVTEAIRTKAVPDGIDVAADDASGAGVAVPVPSRTESVSDNADAPAPPTSTNTPATDRDAVPSGKGIVCGNVLAEDGRPAPGATMTLREIDLEEPRRSGLVRSAKADGQGAFEITGLPSATYLTIAEQRQASGQEEVQISSAATTQRVTLRLKATGSITGIVRDGSGQPVPHASVFPFEPTVKVNDFSKYTAIGLRADASVDGTFTLRHLQPPAWRLYVQADGFATKRTDPIPVGRGTAEIVLSRGGGITGQTVMLDTGAPVGGVSIRLSPQWLGSVSTASGGQGAFQFDALAAGKYWLEVVKDDLVPDGGPLQVALNEDGDTAEVRVALTAGGTIAGRVHDAATREGLPGIAVTARAKGGPTRTVQTDETGAYRVEGLLQGNYDLSADRPKGYLDPGYANEKVVAVRQGEVTEDIDFPSRKGLAATGHVVDTNGAPVANARIDASPAVWYASATTGEDGAFELSPLEPSDDFRISATAEGLVAEPQGPYVLREPGLTGIEVVMIPAGSIAGTLVTPEGKPVANMEMHAWPVRGYGGFAIPTDTTDHEGAFAFRDLYPASHRMVVSPPGSHSIGNNELARVDLAEGEHVTDLVLIYDENEGFTISGRVTDNHGAPIPNAEVTCEGPVQGANKTDENGVYGVTRLLEGLYHVQIRCSQGTASRPGVVAGTENVDFTLAERGLVEGTVIASDTGEPVTAFQYTMKPGVFQHLPPFDHGDMRNGGDLEGHFTAKASPCDVTIFARAPGYAMARAVVTVRPGSEGPTPVTLALAPGGSFELSVTNAAGAPVANAAIYLGEIKVYDRPNNHDAFSIGATDANGLFAYDMFESRYTTAYVTHPGYAPGAADLGAARAGIPIPVVLSRGGILEGTVMREGTPVAAGEYMVSVSYPPNPALGRLLYRPTGSTYRIERVVPGEVLVEAALNQAEPNHAARSTYQPAVVAEGAVTVVDFDIPARDAAVAGRVHEGGLATVQAVVDAVITLASGEEERLYTTTDNTGRFHIADVPPGTGEIEVLLWEHWVDPEARRRMGPVPLETRPGETTTVYFDFAE